MQDILWKTSAASELIEKFVDLAQGDYLKKYEEFLSKSLSIKPTSLRKQLTEIDSAFEDEQLVVVLGAGVSVEYGLPSWETLLQKLLIGSFSADKDEGLGKSTVLAKLFTKAFSPNPLIAARYLRHHYKDQNSKNAFEKAVRGALYETLDNDLKSDLFIEFAQLCVAPGKTPNLDSIITYNYDDILETHLDNLNIDIPYKSISEVGIHANPGQLPIYHVHGYLPRKGKLSESNLITLSEDAYHQQYGDTYSWNNLVQINKFRDKICLFIGLSLTDPNIRRLLDIANKQRGGKETQHYVIRKRHNPENLEEQLKIILSSNPEMRSEKSQASLMLDEATADLIKVMETFETQDDRSFGIDTIWINSYEDMPTILKAIRERSPVVDLATPNK